MNLSFQNRRGWQGLFRLILLCFGLTCPLSADAAERIDSFRSDLVVAADGLFDVTETITVTAEGNKIKQGIYRDIPVRYSGGPFGLKTSVPFNLISITYDGQPASFHTESHDVFTRIYIGRKGVTIPHGQHTYVIRYTTRQLRYFDDHDEVYWNATGHAWAFPIDEVIATVTLPPTVPLDQVDPEGYVGGLRSKNQQDLTAEVSLNQRQVIYKTTRKLGAGEGLTIVARFPAGIIEQPSALRGVWDDPYFRWGFGGLAVVLIYYLIAWWLVGRDPAKGVIVPQYEIPDGLSPAACRFISRMGYDNECFSVALLSLATQGVITIGKEGGSYTLEKIGAPSAMASSGERKVFLNLLSDLETLPVDQKHHTRFARAIGNLRDSLVAEFEGSLFRPNRVWFFAGVAIAVAALFAAVSFSGGMAQSDLVRIVIMVLQERIPPAGPPKGDLVVIFILWLSILSAGVVVIVHKSISAWRSALLGATGLSRLEGINRAIFLTIFATLIIGVEIFFLVWLANLTSLWLIPLVLGIVTTVAVFYEILKAPTISGRAVMDKIAGLRMYLDTAEQDRLEAHTQQALNQSQGLPRTLELFEYFLPYAVALDVANQWAEQFKDIIEAASIDTKSGSANTYHPAWYHGNDWSTASIGAAAAGLGTAMTSAVVAAATSPTSSGSGGGYSGGGGGGFSGGGGGGGGGGGW
jgi:hypothetical protein